MNYHKQLQNGEKHNIFISSKPFYTGYIESEKIASKFGFLVHSSSFIRPFPTNIKKNVNDRANEKQKNKGKSFIDHS